MQSLLHVGKDVLLLQCALKTLKTQFVLVSQQATTLKLRTKVLKLITMLC